MEASREVLDYAASLPIGAHAALFHESEKIAGQIFASYVRGAVERLEQVYFMSDLEDDQERFLKPADLGTGLDPPAPVSYLPLMGFLENGRLNGRKARRQLQVLAGNVVASQAKGVRLIVLADQYLTRTSRDDLAEFEKEWGWTLRLPVSMICSYDTRVLADPNWGDLILQLAKSHGHLMFKGLATPKTESLAKEPFSRLSAYSRSLDF